MRGLSWLRGRKPRIPPKAPREEAAERPGEQGGGRGGRLALPLPGSTSLLLAAPVLLAVALLSFLLLGRRSPATPPPLPVSEVQGAPLPLTPPPPPVVPVAPSPEPGGAGGGPGGPSGSLEPSKVREEGAAEAPPPLEAQRPASKKKVFGLPPELAGEGRAGSRARGAPPARPAPLPVPTLPPPPALPKPEPVPPTPLEAGGKGSRVEEAPALRCLGVVRGKNPVAVIEADGVAYTLVVGEEVGGVLKLEGIGSSGCAVVYKGKRLILKLGEEVAR